MQYLNATRSGSKVKIKYENEKKIGEPPCFYVFLLYYGLPGNNLIKLVRQWTLYTVWIFDIQNEQNTKSKIRSTSSKISWDKNTILVKTRDTLWKIGLTQAFPHILTFAADHTTKKTSLTLYSEKGNT